MHSIQKEKVKIKVIREANFEFSPLIL